MSQNASSLRETAGDSRAESDNRRGVVPYIASWSEERAIPTHVIERRGSGIAFLDESLLDRDERGVLWQRVPVSRGQGKPVFGKIHPLRQRRAMSRLLCSICAGPPDINDDGVLWLLRNFRDDWPSWPEGMAATEPPVCLPCARLSIRMCPALKLGFVAVRVGQSTVAGVWGALYKGGNPLPVSIGEATVTFDDPASRWIVAAQLIRELTQTRIIELG